MLRADERPRPASPRAGVRRRRIALIGAITALTTLGVRSAAAGIDEPPARPGSASAATAAALRVRATGRAEQTYALANYSRSGRLDRAALARAVRRDLPAEIRVRRGAARVTYRYDIATASSEIRRLPRSGGSVAVTRRAVAGRVAAPIIAQALRNNCESAALSILLATQGVRAAQLSLLGELPRSGAPDPVATATGRIWGDPDLGFVGRPDGGGAAGGFGVYPGPVAKLSARHGVRLANLSGSGPAAVYRALRQGRAVMAWIGLSDGPYGTWVSPRGRNIKVNFGEHTIVLNGIAADGTLEVSNPLRGTHEFMRPAQFELLFARLGMRALATTD